MHHVHKSISTGSSDRPATAAKIIPGINRSVNTIADTAQNLIQVQERWSTLNRRAKDIQVYKSLMESQLGYVAR